MWVNSKNHQELAQYTHTHTHTHINLKRLFPADSTINAKQREEQNTAISNDDKYFMISLGQTFPNQEYQNGELKTTVA